MKQKPITLNDVAEYAGVSYQTVSRVLNQAPHVSSRTRSKVEQAMAALNYTPNRVAQQLAGKTITTLGLVTTDLSLHAPSQIAAAIKSTASQLGINIVMSMLSSPDVNSCNNAVNDLLSQRVSGVIVNVPLSTDDVAHISQTCAGTPVLFMDADPHTDILNVMFDPDHGARLAITHLVQLGHQHIALLTGPMTSISARLRYEGWLAELKNSSSFLRRCCTETGAPRPVTTRRWHYWDNPCVSPPLLWRTIKWRLASYARCTNMAFAYQSRCQ